MKQHLQKQHPQMGKWLKCIYKIIWKLYNYTSYKFHDGIVIDGYIFTRRGKWTHNNLGDDLSIPLIEELTGKKIFLKKDVGVKRHLLCIGSIIERYTSADSIIWGSGAIYGDRDLTYTPKRVYAVRGPYTKRFLEKQGIQCPNIYGDPALLLPYIYNPPIIKKYKLGIIPHYVDYDLLHVKNFRDTHPEILFISFKNYTSWKDVICQIKSCEHIISSSLHGLIISDAYGVPNIRVKFSHAITGGDFKYKDYYGGVGRKYVDAIDFTKEIDLSTISSLFDNYTPIKYNAKRLLQSFPYPSKLAPKFKKIIEAC